MISFIRAVINTQILHYLHILHKRAAFNYCTIFIFFMRVGFNYSLVKYEPRPGVLDPRIETRSAQVPFYFETFIWTTLSRDSNADTKDNYFSTLKWLMAVFFYPNKSVSLLYHNLWHLDEYRQLFSIQVFWCRPILQIFLLKPFQHIWAPLRHVV